MNIYIASSWVNRYKLREVREQLSKYGHEVTSQWINVGGKVDDHSQDQLEAAKMDIDDIISADILIVDASLPSSRGGYIFEAGFAHGRNIDVVVVGKHPCTFFNLFPHYVDWKALMVDVKKGGLRS